MNYIVKNNNIFLVIQGHYYYKNTQHSTVARIFAEGGDEVHSVSKKFNMQNKKSLIKIIYK